VRVEDDLRAEGDPHSRVERRRRDHPQRRHVRHKHFVQSGIKKISSNLNIFLDKRM